MVKKGYLKVYANNHNDDDDYLVFYFNVPFRISYKDDQSVIMTGAVQGSTIQSWAEFHL